MPKSRESESDRLVAGKVFSLQNEQKYAGRGFELVKERKDYGYWIVPQSWYLLLRLWLASFRASRRWCSVQDLSSFLFPFQATKQTHVQSRLIQRGSLDVVINTCIL